MSDRDFVLDSDPEEFRRAGHAAIDWVADYLEQIRDRRVLSNVEPGEIARRFDDTPPATGRPFDDLLAAFDRDVMPGVTHWNHPRFFAYFSITGSRAGILGELLSAALNVNGMLWRTSPSATELETKVLDWVRSMLGLPEGLFGIINDTASINTFLALAAAREALGLEIRDKGMTGRALPRLRVYCSDQAHSSVDKGALALGFGTAGIVRVPSDDAFRMDVDALEKRIAEDRAKDAVPCAIVATLGTTSTAAVDPLRRIAAVAKRENAWLHVDAAYGGPSALVDEYREIFDGVEDADSIVVNPHKWLFTPVDCSILYTKRPEVLKRTFSLVPDYLQTTESDVINYMDYGLQLGRRFRAIKLWMVLSHYGTERIRAAIASHVAHASRLADELRAMNDIEIVAPPSMSVVVFRRVVRDTDGAVDEDASERASTELVDAINASGKAFVSHTRLRGRYAIRVAIGNGAVVWDDLDALLGLIRG